MPNTNEGQRFQDVPANITLTQVLTRGGLLDQFDNVIFHAQFVLPKGEVVAPQLLRHSFDVSRNATVGRKLQSRSRKQVDI